MQLEFTVHLTEIHLPTVRFMQAFL